MMNLIRQLLKNMAPYTGKASTKLIHSGSAKHGTGVCTDQKTQHIGCMQFLLPMLKSTGEWINAGASVPQRGGMLIDLSS